MLFDDYLWPTQGMPGSWPHSPPSFDSPEHPKPGIDAFLGIMREELEVTPAAWAPSSAAAGS